MPILFKCACGALWKADKDYIGQEFTCATCQQTQAIPAESDPDCVLVYRSGLPANGLVMLLTDLQKRILSHEFTGNDLIMYDETWVPISSVFDSMPDPIPEPEPQGTDIATSFQQLPNITEKIECQAPNSTTKTRLLRKLARLVTLPRRSATGGAIYYSLLSLFSLGILLYVTLLILRFLHR